MDIKIDPTEEPEDPAGAFIEWHQVDVNLSDHLKRSRQRLLISALDRYSIKPIYLAIVLEEKG